jgi:hypothetical protein
MITSKIEEIETLLCKKSFVKQEVYKITVDTFSRIKEIMHSTAEKLTPTIAHTAPSVEVKYSEHGNFEAHLKFSGDTIVVMMHTNVFDFDNNHHIGRSNYVKEDPMREFCGLIQIYNFLSDSLKYNREHDMGYLIARIFVNKDKHFFIDGKRPLSFLYGDFEKNIITEDIIKNIIEEAMLFCLNFDLMAPPVDAINFISVEQKNIMSYSSGMPTVKKLGFVMQKDDEPIV